MPVGDDAWLRSVREGQAYYWANVTPEQLAERWRKSAETRAKNRERYEERLRQRTEADRKAEERKERTRQRRLKRLDEGALEVIGPAPVWKPTYVEAPGSSFPGPPSDGPVRPSYVLRRAKFWDFIEMDDHGGCWPWHGAPNPYWDDYGWASFMGSHQGAHRVAWMLYFRLIIPVRWVGDHMGQVYDRTGGQLDIRVRPSAHERLPDPDGLRDLALTIGLLPDAVTRSGAQRVRVTGGAHLSVAFAIGAALPSSRVGRLDVVDQRGVTWTSGAEAAASEPAFLQIKNEGSASRAISGRPAVAVYLDLTGSPSDAAYERFLEEHGGGLTAWQQIGVASPGLLDPGEAAALAGEAAARIRALSTAKSNAQVHLLLRCPFPLAVQVGRLTNTLRVTAYEWEDSEPAAGGDYRPRFVPTMTLRASAPDGVITDVLL